MDRYRIDGHKLIYHLQRVDDWLKGESVYPVYMEISPSGSCNHRCIFCAYDFIGYPNRKIETERLLSFIDEIAECGVKSVLYAGEREPLLHPDIDRFVVYSKNRGIDVGIYTNGHLLSRELSLKMLHALTFIRFSFNGGTPENYASIHRVKPGIFDRVLKNIKTAVEIKAKENPDMDIGAQYVLIPENRDFLFDAVKILKDAGIDYVAIKPFVQQSHLQAYKMKGHLHMDDLGDTLDRAESFSDENFRVIARRNSFESYGIRNYRHCYGASFISVLNSGGDVASCLPYWDREEFIFGSIYERSFGEIWNGERRQKIKELLENKLDVLKCPPNCRPNAVNEFLWEIKNPSVKHLNFI